MDPFWGFNLDYSKTFIPPTITYFFLSSLSFIPKKKKKLHNKINEKCNTHIKEQSFPSNRNRKISSNLLYDGA